MYDLVVLNSAARELRKFDKPIRTRIVNATDRIAENPYIGEMLKGDLAIIYSYHLKIMGVEYPLSPQLIPANKLNYLLLRYLKEFLQQFRQALISFDGLPVIS